MTVIVGGIFTKVKIMSDKETIKSILTKAGVKIYEEETSLTIGSQSHIGDYSVHTLFSFNKDGSLKTCRGYRAEDY